VDWDDLFLLRFLFGEASEGTALLRQGGYGGRSTERGWLFYD
jgi:hypothetical protein